MRKLIQKIIIIMFLIIFMINIKTYAVTFSSGSIDIETNNNKIEVGDIFTVSVLIPGSMSSETVRSVKEANIKLIYDSKIINCLDIEKTERNDYFGYITLNSEIGRVNYNFKAYEMYALSNGSVFFKATFKAINSGDIRLELIYDQIGDKNGNQLQSFNNQKKIITIKSIVKLKSICLNKEYINMEENCKENLFVLFNPNDTTVDRNITWKSSNENVVEVNNDGIITAKKEGDAIIFAECSGKIASCNVKVCKNNTTIVNNSVLTSEEKNCDKSNKDKNMSKHILDNEPKTGKNIYYYIQKYIQNLYIFL